MPVDTNDAFVVQFPHPGDEPSPTRTDLPWNRGDHTRKFMLGHGRYLDDVDGESEADLVFWGEWEAPSRVIRRWPPSGQLPRALHAPYWSTPPPGPRQNTDPWVFGTEFRYSNCKQSRTNRPTSMQRLTRGSMIIFGSAKAMQFVIDTVFIIASAQPWTPTDTHDLQLDEAFRTCTAESLLTGTDCAPGRFTLYTGATPQQPVNGMYSFVPALRAADQDVRFSRPAIRLPGLINPASTRSTRGSRHPRSASEVCQTWHAVREQVLAHGCLLATRMDTPPWHQDAPPPQGRTKIC